MGYCGKVEITGVNTAKLEVLKKDEAVELFKRAKCGDTAVSYTHLDVYKRQQVFLPK